MSEKNIIVPLDEKSQMRLDAYLAQHYASVYSRSKITKYIKEGYFLVNGKTCIPSYHIKAGDSICTRDQIPDESHDIIAENIALDILYEDDDIIVLNKQPGIVVHPAPGNKQHTLVNALQYHTKGKLSHVGGRSRPGIIHRLDKDTSGILIVSKNNYSHNCIARQFKKHTVEKIYAIIVKGIVQHDHGKCNAPIGRARIFRKRMIVRGDEGKEALSEYIVRERFTNNTFLNVQIHTGRTHQIRVHMAHMGHPVLGDTLYGTKSTLINRQCIHAASISFMHPRHNQKIVFEAPLPDDMKQVIKELKKSC